MKTWLQHLAEALGNGIMYSLLTGLALYILLRIVLALLKGIGSGYKYIVSNTTLLIVLVAFVYPFKDVLYMPANTPDAAMQNIIADLPAYSIPNSSVQTNTIINKAPDKTFYETISTTFYTATEWLQEWNLQVLIIYLTGLFFFSLKLWLSWLYAIGLKKNGISTINEHWLIALQTAKEKLGIRKNIGIRFSSKVATPCIIGYSKALILIPISLATGFTTEQSEAILLHELAHFRHYDYYINILMQSINCILFFNPFAWLISRKCKQYREQYCDETAAKQNREIALAESLAYMAQLKPAGSNFVLGMKQNERSLFSRIQNILTTKKNPKRYVSLLSGGITTMILLALILIHNADSYSQKKEQKKEKTIEKTEAKKPVIEDLALYNIFPFNIENTFENHKIWLTSQYTQKLNLSGEQQKLVYKAIVESIHESHSNPYQGFMESVHDVSDGIDSDRKKKMVQFIIAGDVDSSVAREIEPGLANQLLKEKLKLILTVAQYKQFMKNEDLPYYMTVNYFQVDSAKKDIGKSLQLKNNTIPEIADTNTLPFEDLVKLNFLPSDLRNTSEDHKKWLADVYGNKLKLGKEKKELIWKAIQESKAESHRDPYKWFYYGTDLGTMDIKKRKKIFPEFLAHDTDGSWKRGEEIGTGRWLLKEKLKTILSADQYREFMWDGYSLYLSILYSYYPADIAKKSSTASIHNDGKSNISGPRFIRYKGNKFEMSYADTNKNIWDGDLRKIVTRVNPHAPRPIKINGAEIISAHGIEDMELEKTISKLCKSFSDYLYTELQPLLIQLEDGRYDLAIRNVIIDNKGRIVYYEFMKNIIDDPRYEGIKRSIDKKLGFYINKQLEKDINQKIWFLMEHAPAFEPLLVKGVAVHCNINFSIERMFEIKAHKLEIITAANFFKKTDEWQKRNFQTSYVPQQKLDELQIKRRALLNLRFLLLNAKYQLLVTLDINNQLLEGYIKDYNSLVIQLETQMAIQEKVKEFNTGDPAIIQTVVELEAKKRNIIDVINSLNISTEKEIALLKKYFPKSSKTTPATIEEELRLGKRDEFKNALINGRYALMPYEFKNPVLDGLITEYNRLVEKLQTQEKEQDLGASNLALVQTVIELEAIKRRMLDIIKSSPENSDINGKLNSNKPIKDLAGKYTFQPGILDAVHDTLAVHIYFDKDIFTSEIEILKANNEVEKIYSVGRWWIDRKKSFLNKFDEEHIHLYQKENISLAVLEYSNGKQVHGVFAVDDFKILVLESNGNFFNNPGPNCMAFVGALN